LDANIRKVLDQLIAKEFVEPAGQHSLARYKHSRKASQLFAEPCVRHMESRIQSQLRAGKGILKVARELGLGTSTVQRIAREMEQSGPFDGVSDAA
jgi:hypothetical protein